MLIDNPEVERLLDEVAELAGETRAEALRLALVERRARLVAAPRPDPAPLSEAEARLAAWRQLQDSVALTPEAAEAWAADVRAERDAHRMPGDVG